MRTTHINEKAFDSYKNKVSKETKNKELRKETSSIIKKSIIKEVLPMFKAAVTSVVRSIERRRRTGNGNPTIWFELPSSFTLTNFNWYNDDDYEIIPELDLHSDILLIKIPVSFANPNKLNLNGAFISEDAAIVEKIEKALLTDENIKTFLIENEIKDVNVKLDLNKYDVFFDEVWISHMSNVNYIKKYFSQFLYDVNIITQFLKFYCSFSFEKDLESYVEISKYIKVRDQLEAEISSVVENIDNIKNLFVDNNSIQVKLRISNPSGFQKPASSFLGPNPMSTVISNKILDNYFGGIKYEDIINENPIEEFGGFKHPERTILNNITFTTSKNFDKEEIKNTAEYHTWK